MIRSVSVVIAARNAESTIERAISSAIQQEGVDVEVVVVDDDSTDGTLDIVGSLQSSMNSLQLLSNSTNLGVSRSRNIGLKAASGEFLSTLDADDYYCDRLKLNHEIAAIQESVDQDVIGFSGVLHLAEDGTLIRKAEPNDCPINFETILGRECFIPRDFTLRRELILELGGYDENIAIFEDWDLKLRLSRRAKFAYTGRYGVAYVQHDRGLSSHTSLSYWRNFVFMKHACSIPEPGPRVDALGTLNANTSDPAFSRFYPEEPARPTKPKSLSLKQFEYIAADELPNRLIDETFIDSEFVQRSYGLTITPSDWELVWQFAKQMTARGLDPNPYFNTAFYSGCYGVDRRKCVTHYLAHGWRVGNWPSASFDPAIHLNIFPQARYAGCNPISWLYRQGLAGGKELVAQCAPKSDLAEAGVVSVITINKDNAEGLQRTLSSVAAQRDVDIQSIVIDGGSSDQSREVIAKFADLIDAWTSEPDGGIWHAQEKGLSRASGQWILFMNSGDRFFSNLSLKNLLSRGCFADIIHGQVIEDGWFTPRPYRESLHLGMPFSHQAFVARRELYRRVAFDSQCLVADFKFLIDAYVCGAVFAGTDVVVAGIQPIGVSSTQQLERTLARWALVQSRFGNGYDRDYRSLIHQILGVETGWTSKLLKKIGVAL